MVDGEGCGADDVDKQDGDVAVLAAEGGQLLQRAAGHFCADIAPEQIVDALAFPQATHHFIEARLKHTNFRAVVNADGGVGVAAAHALNGLMKLRNRVHDALGHQGCSHSAGDQRHASQRNNAWQDATGIVVEIPHTLAHHHEQHAQDRHPRGDYPG